MTPPAAYTYVCPECAHSIGVTAAMRTALLACGCVACGAAVAPETFSPG